MKKLSVFLISLISIVSFPSASIAGCNTSNAFSCTDITIDRFYPDSDGLYIDTSGNETKLKCTPTSEKYLRLSITNKNYNLISNVLLKAHESRHPIWVRVNDDSNKCEIIYVVSDR